MIKITRSIMEGKGKPIEYIKNKKPPSQNYDDPNYGIS